MAILTAAQLQTRLSLLARGVLGLAIFWAGIHTALRHLRSPVQCLPPQPVSHSSIDTTSADIKALASEDDERVLRCETGYVIDGFQPLTSALMVCKDAGGGNYGEWQCSASADVAMEVSWRCASRACVEVSHCDPLPDTVDTGHGQMVMDASRCRQVELGRSCTVSCSEGFTGESNFNCQTDGTWQGRPPVCKFIDPARAGLYEKLEQ